MNEILNSITLNKEAITLVFSLVITISTVVYALLTWKLTSETRRMRKTQTEPKISIYLKPCQVSMLFFDLVIKNIGLGVAYNVKFKVLEEFDISEDRKLSEIDFIKEGINYMPPDYSVETYFLHILGQYERIIDKKIKIKITYKNSEGRGLSEIINLNMSQFKGIQKIVSDPLNKIAKNIESLQKDIHYISSGFHHLRVDTYASEDREKIKAERERQREEIRQKQQKSEEKKNS